MRTAVAAGTTTPAARRLAAACTCPCAPTTTTTTSSSSSSSSGTRQQRRRPPRSAAVPAAAPDAAGARDELVVGIDLGTTNSAVAYITPEGRPACIPNAAGDTLTPSVVCFRPPVGGENDGAAAAAAPLVGRAARAAQAQHPSTTYYSAKRLIGRSWATPAVQEEAARLAYEVAPDSEGNTVLVCPHVEPGCLYPEEVSACVLSQLLADAAAHTRAAAPITKAVITVPAYFDDEQREATVAAGKLAGLETVRLIREPVAAALAYGLDLREEQVVLVFDLGGGTLDVSLLEVGNGTIEVLSTGGDAHLGGDDWDAAIVAWLRSGYLDAAGVDCSSPGMAARLKALAEYAKVTLSDSEQVVLRMPVGGPDGGALQVTLDQQGFDELSTELFQRARLPLDQACWNAGVDLNELQMSFQAKREDLARRGVPKWKQELLKLEIRPKSRAAVNKVLVVGGATRMPAVKRFLTNMTGLPPEANDAIDPDEAVALGAAVQAGILQGQVDSLMVMDQWQASLMRALAQLQLQESPSTRARVQEKFQLDDASGTARAAAEQAGARSQAQEVEAQEGQQQAPGSLRGVQAGASQDPEQQQQQQQQPRQATLRGKLSSKRAKKKRPQAG